jgi:hypothetical protein
LRRAAPARRWSLFRSHKWIAITHVYCLPEAFNPICEVATREGIPAHPARLEMAREFRGKVWLLAAKDCNVRRYREEGRSSNAPDTKRQEDLARARAEDIPVLMLPEPERYRRAGLARS